MTRDYTTWEEDFTSDTTTFRDENDKPVGEVCLIGSSSWQASYRGTVIAITPNQRMAIQAVVKAHAEGGVK